MTMTEAPKIRYEWFQNDEYVNLSVFIKNVSDSQVSLDLQDKSLSLSIERGADLPTYVLDLSDLSHEIVPANSSFKCMSTKVELKLRKKTVGIKWGALEGDAEKLLMNSALNATAPPAYPSSSKKAVNWTEVEKSVVEDKPEGEQALNGMFQQIFRDGDENVKRAMMKSFVESGGTTLSTNWKEVEKEVVPIRPPDGMEAKKWE